MYYSCCASLPHFRSPPVTHQSFSEKMFPVSYDIRMILYRIISYPIRSDNTTPSISHHIVSCHAMSYDALSNHIISCHIMHIISYPITVYDIISHRMMLLYYILPGITLYSLSSITLNQQISHFPCVEGSSLASLRLSPLANPR